MEQQNRANIMTVRYYLFRKRMFQNHINAGHSGPILFPEIIKNLPIEEIQGWAINESNYKFFLDTLAFLGLDFELISEDYRNPTNETLTGKLINSYKHFLNYDDAKFNALFDKFMEMKMAINNRQITHSQTIYDEETDADDDESTVVDENISNNNINNNKYIIPNTLEPHEIPKSSVQIKINNSDEGFDVIDGDRNVLEYLDESPDNVVFIINTTSGSNKYFLTSKEQLQTIIQDKTNIHYKCLKMGPQLLYIPSKDVIKDQPLLKMTSLGLPIQYVFLKEMKRVLESDKQIYLISNEPVEKFKAVASHDILDQDENMASGAHCQYVEGYPLHSIYTLTYLDLDDVRENIKRQRTTGGKTRRKKMLSMNKQGKKSKNKRGKKSKKVYSKKIKVTKKHKIN